MRIRLPYIVMRLSVLTMCVGAVACSSDDDKYNDRIMYSSIVTIASSGEGEGTVFTFRRYDDSPLITLTAPDRNVAKEHIGERALLYYYPESGDPYASGPITIRSLGAINCDTAIIRPISRYAWDKDAVFLNAIWRTGGYINLRMRADYSDKPRYFGLVVDSLTMTDPWPEAYLLHNLDGAPPNYLRESYASFDISKVWNQPGCKGLRIHVNDTNRPADIYEFPKKQ